MENENDESENDDLETQSSASLRSTCPNHLSLPRLTTLSTTTIPSQRLSSSLDLLSFRVTPDIHLTMLFSVLTSLCISIHFHRPSFATIHKHPLYQGRRSIRAGARAKPPPKIDPRGQTGKEHA